MYYTFSLIKSVRDDQIKIIFNYRHSAAMDTKPSKGSLNQFMKLVKPQKIFDCDWLWQYEDRDKEANTYEAVDETTILFGVFFIDRFSNSTDNHMKDLLEKLTSHFEDWNQHYPWSDFNNVCLQVNIIESRFPLIMGQLTVEENLREEEGLIIALLQDFSRQMDSQIFIRVCDTDGDFVLIENYDALPEDYEYPRSNNRLWLHEGNFKIIPQSFKCGQGLSAGQALEFLEREYFKLLNIKKLSSSISKKMIDGYPTKYLKNIVKLPLMIEDKNLEGILKANPQIISLLIGRLIKQDLDVPCGAVQKNSNCFDFLIPKRHSDMLSLFLGAKALEDSVKLKPLYCGRALCEVLKSLIKDHTISLEVAQEPRQENSETTKFKLENFAYASLDSNSLPFESAHMNEENLVDEIEGFFKDSTKDRDWDNPDLYRTESEEEEDLNEECRKYFEKENIDIDEDDFFEFFFKEALNLNMEDVIPH